MLCILYQEVHLLENILKTLRCSLAGYCPPSVDFRIGIFCFGVLAKDLLISCLLLPFPLSKYCNKLLTVSLQVFMTGWFSLNSDYR